MPRNSRELDKLWVEQLNLWRAQEVLSPGELRKCQPLLRNRCARGEKLSRYYCMAEMLRCREDSSRRLINVAGAKSGTSLIDLANPSAANTRSHLPAIFMRNAVSLTLGRW